MVNAAVELMPSDHEVARLVERGWGTIEVALTVTLTRAIDRVADDEVVELFDTNAIGTWLCMKHEIASVREQGHGVLVNLGSVIGTELSRACLTAFATSKAPVRR